MAKKASKKAPRSVVKSAGKTAKKAGSTSSRKVAAKRSVKKVSAKKTVPTGLILAAALKLPAKPSRATVKPRVLNAIDDEAARNSASSGKRTLLVAGDETLVLEPDLNINATRRTALSVDYSTISQSYEGGISVGQIEARNAKSVKQAITLVHKMANGG